MFERFKQMYKVTYRLPPDPSGTIVTRPLENTPGYEEFMREFAGASFNSGVYRVHTLKDRAKWTRLVAEAFPKFAGNFSVFGYDWVGRQFALDALRQENGQALVVLFDPGFGEALKIPGTFESFHEKVLIEMSEAALLGKVFQQWLDFGNRAPAPAECVGHKVPMLLGGVDEFSNYELTDMEVYWGLNAQLIAQTRNQPDGTLIGKVTTE